MSGHVHLLSTYSLSFTLAAFFIEHRRCSCGYESDKPLGWTPMDEPYLIGKLGKEGQ